LSCPPTEAGAIRELISGGDVPPAVRLKACCVILTAAEALRAEPIGPTSAEGVRARLRDRDLLESLGA
jgi:hypothetical protein